MYGIPPRLSVTEPISLLDDPYIYGNRLSETLAVQSARAGKARQNFRYIGTELKMKTVLFDVGDEVRVAKGKSFGSLNMRTIEIKWFEACVVAETRHPRYISRGAGSKITSEAIHARRPRLFHGRPDHLPN